MPTTLLQPNMLMLSRVLFRLADDSGGFLPAALYRPCFWLIVLALFVPAAASADNDNEALMQDVQQFLHEKTRPLGEEVVIDLTPPSPHLPECVDPEPFLPNADASPLGRVSIGVRCGQQQQRQVRYMRAQVDVIGDYVVAADDLPRETRITPAMLETQSGNLGKLSPRTLTQEDAVVGQITRQPIRSGSAFQSQDVRAPLMVRRGDDVKVIAQGEGFRVSREGEAMEDGSKGEQIRVRFGQRDIRRARVVDDDLLAIDF